MKPIYWKNIPEELARLPNWVVWKHGKVPYVAGTYRQASVTNPNAWRSFGLALDTVRSGHADGIGFVFTNSPFAGVDLDHCIRGGQLAPWADAIIMQLNSYTEVSPSDAGLHIILRADLPSGRRRCNVELYSSGRYFTMTGHVWGCHHIIHQRQVELRALYDQLAPRPPPIPNRQRGHGGDSQTVLDKALLASNGAKFARLYAGNTDRYRSHSEADLALCSMLAYWSNSDQVVMDSLFRDSGLYRPKWDIVHSSTGQTYGQMTIQKAMS